MKSQEILFIRIMGIAVGSLLIIYTLVSALFFSKEGSPVIPIIIGLVSILTSANLSSSTSTSKESKPKRDKIMIVLFSLLLGAGLITAAIASKVL
jgi:hypothetical protein